MTGFQCFHFFEKMNKGHLKMLNVKYEINSLIH